MSLDNRVTRLEDIFKPYGQKRQPVPNLVMVDEDGEPISEYYRDVLLHFKEAEARGEDVRLTVLTVPGENQETNDANIQQFGLREE